MAAKGTAGERVLEEKLLRKNVYPIAQCTTARTIDMRSAAKSLRSSDISRKRDSGDNGLSH